MALITCSECGKQVSDQAANCPNCGSGFPEKSNDGISVMERMERQKAKKTKKLLIIWGAIILAAVVVFSVYIGGATKEARYREDVYAATNELKKAAVLLIDVKSDLGYKERMKQAQKALEKANKHIPSKAMDGWEDVQLLLEDTADSVRALYNYSDRNNGKFDLMLMGLAANAGMDYKELTEAVEKMQ